MMIASWFIGQHYYPIRYDLKGIGKYLLLALVLYVIALWIPIENQILRLSFRTILLVLYILYVIKKDLPLKQIPYLNRWAKK